MVLRRRAAGSFPQAQRYAFPPSQSKRRMVVVHGAWGRIYGLADFYARTVLLVAVPSYRIRYGLQLAHDPVVVFYTYRMAPEVHHPAIWRTQAIYQISDILPGYGSWRVPLRRAVANYRLHRRQEWTQDIPFLIVCMIILVLLDYSLRAVFSMVSATRLLNFP